MTREENKTGIRTNEYRVYYRDGSTEKIVGVGVTPKMMEYRYAGKSNVIGYTPRYFDKNGNEILYNSFVKFGDRVEKVYLTSDGELGTDATNPHWIESGKAVPCEYGIYPFNNNDLNNAEIVGADELI